MALPEVALDFVPLAGGLDQITPTLSLPNGFARVALNFEHAVTGGYSRILGYERFDGHDAPAYNAENGVIRYVSVAAYTNTPSVGTTLTASGGATGVIARVNGLVMTLCKITGTWAVGETVAVDALAVGTVNSVYAGPVDPQDDALSKNAVADIYRSAIAAVPGVGPVRGVVMYNDVVYAFRNADATPVVALKIYKSTGSGWTEVTLYKTVSFTAGGTGTPADGATLTQGSVTATIKRVVKTSGSWSAGTAAGQLIITTPSGGGGNFASGAATAGSVNVTLSGAQTAIALSPNGKFEFVEHNFGGQSGTRRLYGCDGVNKAFEFDGDVLVPLTTGATTDTPTHIEVFKNYLFLSIASSALYSSPGNPYDWSAIGGAGEIATGDTITGMIQMSGNAPALAIVSRNNTNILNGTSPVDFNLVSYNTGTGAVPYSLRNMSQTFAFDDRGALTLQAAQTYGDFADTFLTSKILPFINERVNLLTYTTLNRRKSQYRLFFSDGYGLYITVVNGKLLGSMPVYFPNPVYCAFEGKTTAGVDVNFFGSTDGMVYQLDKGTSFDGAAIDYQLQLNFSNAKGPRTLKRYRRASVELASETNAFALFDLGYILGYDSVEYSQPGSSSYSPYLSQMRWDTFTWDQFFWDSAGVEPVTCDLEGTAENIGLFISGSYDYVPAFTVNSALIHYTPRRMMRS